jgi:hypothetical protein
MQTREEKCTPVKQKNFGNAFFCESVFLCCPDVPCTNPLLGFLIIYAKLLREKIRVRNVRSGATHKFILDTTFITILNELTSIVHVS